MFISSNYVSAQIRHIDKRTGCQHNGYHQPTLPIDTHFYRAAAFERLFRIAAYDQALLFKLLHNPCHSGIAKIKTLGKIAARKIPVAQQLQDSQFF